MNPFIWYLIGYAALITVIVVAQTIRLELARNDIDDRDAYIRILMRRPTCAACSLNHDERRAA